MGLSVATMIETHSKELWESDKAHKFAVKSYDWVDFLHTFITIF